MTLPADFGTGTVTATFVGIDGDPTVGSVTFTAVPTRLVSVGTDTIIVPEPIVVPLVDGVLTAVLPATDDEDISPVNFTYRVVENFTNGKTYFIDCPVGSTTDLSDVTPQDPSTGNTVIRVSDGDLTVIGGKDYTIPWMAGWNCPMLVPGIYDGRVFMVGCAVADITPTPPSVSEGELRIVVKVELAFTSAPSDPSESDIPTEWIVAQALESADIYGAVLIPLDNFADNGFPFGVPVWFRGSSIDGDGFTTKIVMFFPEGIPADPAEMTMVSFVNGEKRTDTIPAPPSENAEGEAVDLTTTMPALYDGTAAAVKYVDVHVASAITDLALGSASTHDESDFLAATEKGSASGVAELDEDGLVPSAQLPGFVDDVREVADEAALAGVIAASGVIYIALAENTQWRWSGSTFVQLGAPLALGETMASAYRGDRGKTAYDHSQSTGNPHGTGIADITGLTADLAGKYANTTTLDAITAPAANLSLNSHKITNLTDGTASTDAATFGQIPYPRWISIGCGNTPPNSYNTWTSSYSGVRYGSYGQSIAVSANTETWTYYLRMESGTWTFILVRRTNTNAPRIQPTLGGLALNLVEGWSSPNAGDATATQTGITVSTSGLVTLTFTNPSKHASSGGWGWTIQGFELIRTGP